MNTANGPHSFLFEGAQLAMQGTEVCWEGGFQINEVSSYLVVDFGRHHQSSLVFNAGTSLGNGFMFESLKTTVFNISTAHHVLNTSSLEQIYRQTWLKLGGPVKIENHDRWLREMSRGLPSQKYYYTETIQYDDVWNSFFCFVMLCLFRPSWIMMFQSTTRHKAWAKYRNSSVIRQWQFSMMADRQRIHKLVGFWTL